MDSLRAAIIGCGNIGYGYSEVVSRPGVYSHAHAYAAHPGIALVAACDPDTTKLEACVERWDIPNSFTNYKELLVQAHPDIVSICTPNETHAAIVADVLHYSGVRGLICEKPLALDSASAIQIADAAAQANKPVLVNYSRRFDANYQSLQSDIRNGKLGHIQAVNGFYGKGLFHNGTHWLDQIRFLFGEPTWIQGHQTKFHYGHDQTYSLTIGLRGDMVASLQGTDHNSITIFEMDIVGTKGRVRVTDGGRQISYHSTTGSDFQPENRDFAQTPYKVVDALSEALPGAIENMVSHITRSTPLICTTADGIASLLLAEAARYSVKSQARVVFPARGKPGFDGLHVRP